MTFDKARRELLDELRRLGARNVVISSWLPLRNDGHPRADAARMRIEDPGVAVYFQRGERQMVIARDAFWSVHDRHRAKTAHPDHGGSDVMMAELNRARDEALKARSPQ